MQASTVGTLTIGHYGTIFVAIELSQKSWLVTLHSPDRDRISRHKLEGGDHAGLLALIEKHPQRGRRTSWARRLEVVSCYEAGYDGFWLHRLLTGGRDHEPRVRPCQHCGGAAGAASQDRPDRRRAAAAHADGVFARRAAGGADRACAEREQETPAAPAANASGWSRNRPPTPTGSRRCCGCWAWRSAIRAGATG